MDQKFNSPDNLPAPVESGEHAPGVFEQGANALPEKHEQNVGAPAIGVQQATDDAAAAASAAQSLAVDPLVAGAAQAAQGYDAAKDVDVIEKELVEKAKAIIAKTKDDPRAQSVELSGMKREYIKNRFGKSLPDNQSA